MTFIRFYFDRIVTFVQQRNSKTLVYLYSNELIAFFAINMENTVTVETIKDSLSLYVSQKWTFKGREVQNKQT